MKLANLERIKVFHSTLFAYYLDKLKATPDGEGSLLDHSCLLWGSGMSDSNAHSPLDVPYLMVGKAAGAFQARGHIASAKGTQLADIMLTVAQRYGVETNTFGVSSKPFAL